MKIVFAAILWLAPHLGADTAKLYAGLIAGHSEDATIDPLLVVAIIHLESRWKVDATSRTNDFGLMQIHVSRTTYRRYLGREKLLFDPYRNIRLGLRLLRHWRDFHQRTCGGDQHHPFWAHYKYGVRIPKRREGAEVDEVYELLRTRFGQPTI